MQTFGVPSPGHRSWHIRVRMLGAPGQKFLVFCQHRINQLIDDIVRRLAEELRVRVQRLVVLTIQPRNMSHELFASCARFDHRHEDLLPVYAVSVLTRSARASARSCAPRKSDDSVLLAIVIAARIPMNMWLAAWT